MGISIVRHSKFTSNIAKEKNGMRSTEWAKQKIFRKVKKKVKA